MVQMFERWPRDPNASVDKIERLMALWERGQARTAEASFNEAMAQAQKAMRPVAADASNPQTRSRYASYAALDRALRPIYTENGFGLSFDTGDPPMPDYVRVLCYVTHLGGHSRTYHADMPADGKGAKGGDVMTKTHAVGSAMSYGVRYLLKMIFNVAVREDDDDGIPRDRRTEGAGASSRIRRLADGYVGGCGRWHGRAGKGVEGIEERAPQLREQARAESLGIHQDEGREGGEVVSFMIIDVPQRSPEWFAARAGRLTASRVADIFKTRKDGKEAADRRNMRLQLVLERLTGRCQESGYQSLAMQQGIEREIDAVGIYEALTGQLLTRTGFLQHNDLMAGCSWTGI
jgi:hypothetical protein